MPYKYVEAVFCKRLIKNNDYACKSLILHHLPF